MTTGQASSSSLPQRMSTADVLLDGLFTGMIGALVVALWFLVLDLLAGRPLYTPALLGAVLLHGSASVQDSVVIAPVDVAAYTAIHFLAFIVFGIAFSYLMNLFERFPIMFFVLLVLFVSLQLGFFTMNLALGVQLFGKLKPWTVVVANLLAALAMAAYQWKRHPSVMRGVEHLWEDEG